ncbi:hypothetical protein, conserved [Trypanosoma brucei gambiense DAL972]|uniref:MsrB domain-containing protein n=1 Tax=Trypanosoma brucei gambiense (strain MHOM/CI/86/DAL972) TaxID=679716 RepID=D0A160_TRYB9|nr:hypothetical protein, conserved [Trypanosoma brucei gambiense DAL972]CBH15002.1 hypothetical protein, conserved [Trypanosoma brucei gambiense DAL972]|eukprot:XP_011777268.1 hypothetical protein, conserved [Trypanosoma brucei gambiense DAL972]
MHPEIEALKRRNRAAGKRLVPIEPDHTNRQSRSTSCSVRRNGSISSLTARTPQSLEQSAERVHEERRQVSSLTSRFTATAPISVNKSYNNRNDGMYTVANGRMGQKPQLSIPRVPARPPVGVRGKTRNNLGSFVRTPTNGEDPVACVSGPAVANVSKVGNKISPEMCHMPSSGGGLSSTSVHPAEKDVIEEEYRQHMEESLNDGDEVSSLGGHLAKHEFKSVPDHIRRMLEGDRIEEPYTTKLWEQINTDEGRRTNGYYECIRCGMPLVSPKHQIRFFTRGIAAFSLMHWDGVEVRVGGVASSNNKSKSCGTSEALQLQVRCKCCSGFVGILVPDPEGEPRNIFVVNSCCLSYVKDKRTRCKLSKPCGAHGDDGDGSGMKRLNSRNSRASEGDVEIDFNDPDIFEID